MGMSTIQAIEREFLERSRSIVGSMASLVGDLLELSRLESGSLVLDMAPVLGRRCARTPSRAG